MFSSRLRERGLSQLTVFCQKIHAKIAFVNQKRSRSIKKGLMLIVCDYL